MSNGELFENDSDKLDPARVMEHMEDPAFMHRYEGTLKGMVEIAEFELRKTLPPELTERAEAFAMDVVFALCDRLGGSVMYLPRGTVLQKAIRDTKIFRDWKDRNVQPADLVLKYKLSSPSIYQILSHQRALHRRKEPDLFGFDPPQGSGSIH